MAPANTQSAVAMEKSEQPDYRTEGTRVAFAGDWNEVDGIESLKRAVRNAGDSEHDTTWADIFMGTCGTTAHLRFGNSKLHKSVANYNLGAASDCPNRWTENCQVDGDECYAVVSETAYPNALSARRRQEYLWDCLDADTFAKAVIRVQERKQNEVNALRFNVASDTRYRGDAIKMNRIAELLEPHDIDVYTYTASDYVDWRPYDYLTVNASNAGVVGADRRYIAVPAEDLIPEDGFHCPADKEGKDFATCGECQACLRPEGDADVYTVVH